MAGGLEGDVFIGPKAEVRDVQRGREEEGDGGRRGRKKGGERGGRKRGTLRFEGGAHYVRGKKD